MGMKRLLAFFIWLLAIAVNAANPSFVDLVQTNILWVAKNGNDSTAKPGNPALKYLTISNAVQAAVKPALVKVAPGVYNESVMLRDRIDLEMPSGVIISNNQATLPILFDDGNAVTNAITGSPFLIQNGNGANAAGIRLSGASDVFINRVDVETFTTVSSGIITTSAGGARLRCFGRVRSRNTGITANGGMLYFNGECYGTNDYGAIISATGSSNYITGVFYGELNSAIHIGGGFTMVEDVVALAFDDSFGWPVEMSGGSGVVNGSRLIAARQEAIGKYGGALLVLSGSTLEAGTNVSVSIHNDGVGSHGSIEIRTPCWANKPASPLMNIVSGGLMVSNVYQSKAPYVISAATRTNAVFDTNGNVTLSNTLVYTATTVAGAGNGNTNYTLLATSAFNYLGSSNVNISAVMRGVANEIRLFTVVVTNLSADTWGFQVSSVTNRWRFFSPMYGTNAPVVLTNNTALMLNCKSDGTNVFVDYNYYRPGL